MNILEALKKYIRANGGSSRAKNISEAVKDLDSIPGGRGGDIPEEVTNAIETGGMGWTEQGEQTFITWDGDTEGRDSFIISIGDLDFPFYKVAEIGDGYTEKALATFFDFEESYECYKVSGNGAFAYDDDILYVIVADGGAFDIEGITSIAPSSGVYFIDAVLDDNEIKASSLTYGTPDTIHQIDQKYIPQGSGGAMVVHFSVEYSDGEVIVGADKTPAEVTSAALIGSVVGVVTFGDSDTESLGSVAFTTSNTPAFRPLRSDDEGLLVYFIRSEQGNWVVQPLR